MTFEYFYNILRFISSLYQLKGFVLLSGTLSSRRHRLPYSHVDLPVSTRSAPAVNKHSRP